MFINKHLIQRLVKRLVKCLNITLSLMLCLLGSASSYAVETCLSINQKTTHYQTLIEEGTYRYLLKNKDVAPFAYQVNTPYSDYLVYAKQHILALGPKAKLSCAIKTNTLTALLAQENRSISTTQVVDLVAPFELAQNNNKKAVLLIHGLTDSPFLFHDLAWFYYQQGFTVRTLLLPGHGTAPEALLNTSFEQWQNASKYAIERTLQDFEEVYLGGYSTGGALIADYLFRTTPNTEKISGIFLWSMASKIYSEQAWLAPYVAKLPFIDWMSLAADSDIAKYESFSFKAGAEVYKLIETMNAQSESERNYPNVPIFVVSAQQDQTIDTAATLSWVNQWHDPIKRPETKHDTVVYYGDSNVVKSQLEAGILLKNPRCEDNDFCEKVHELGHISITSAPSNAYYGEQGAYRNCDHYLSDNKRYQRCKTSSSYILGENTVENLAKNTILRRATYNPYFTEMTEQIALFIKRTSR